MRRSTRLIHTSIDAVIPRASLSRYVCPSCQQRCQSQPILRSQRRHASNNVNLPWTEKVRRKIWGTDTPPGLADPYGGPSYLEQRRAEKEGRTLSTPGQVVEDQAQPQQQQSTEVVEAAERNYLAADNWKGLEVFGGTGHWTEKDPKEADTYSRLVAMTLVAERII